MSDQSVDLYRLTGETIQNDPVGANNGMIGYTYDPVGNRNQRTSSVTPIQMQNFTGQYDQNDRLTAGYTYDPDGSTLTDPSGKTYTYDSLDRLITVSGSGLSENFVYDGDGNKVSQNVNGTITNYLVDTHNLTGYAQVLDELQSGSVNRTYTYGTSRISEDQFNGTTWNMSFYGYDGQGSVRYLMDGSGNVTDTYTTDSLGNSISTTGTTLNTMLFDGEQNDPNTGFYNLRARWMNPGIGRFQSMDSYEGNTLEIPQSLHKYLFVANDPLDKVDPSGHQYGPRQGELLGGIFPAPAWIGYNGAQVIWYLGQTGDVSSPEHIYRAASGFYNPFSVPDYRNTQYQDAELGPIPTGNYTINLGAPIAEAQIIPGINKLKSRPEGGIETIPGNNPDSDWGLMRARLDPAKGTNTFGRFGFYLHDSHKGYTHGCVETSSDIFGLLIEGYKPFHKHIDFVVKYEGTKTHGGP